MHSQVLLHPTLIKFLVEGKTYSFRTTTSTRKPLRSRESQLENLETMLGNMWKHTTKSTHQLGINVQTSP